jgi:uncharacterized protein YcbK (DUF882 family)
MQLDRATGVGPARLMPGLVSTDDHRVGGTRPLTMMVVMTTLWASALGTAAAASLPAAPAVPGAAPAGQLNRAPLNVPAGKSVGKKTNAKVVTRPASPGKKPRTTGSTPPVILYHVNHRETLRLRLADGSGKPVRGLQGQMNRFLRCHYTNKQHAMNPRLTRLLYEIGQHYAGRRIEVVSGYRHPKFAKNPHSPHKQGLACDMRVAGIKNTELRDFFRQRFKSVGVGYYPNSSFVHLDVRRGASAFWIDYSGPGETALYSRNAAEDLRSGRADRWRRSTIDPTWVDTPDEDDEEGVNGKAVEAAPVEGEEADVPEGEAAQEVSREATKETTTAPRGVAGQRRDQGDDALAP